jgi:hypothetical protein
MAKGTPIGDLAAEAVDIPAAGSPAGRVPGGDDAVDAVRGKEAVFDPLRQTVRVDWIAKVPIGVAVVLAQRCGGHAELVCGCEVLEDLAPGAGVAGAAPVAFVDDNKVEEIGGIFLVQAWSPLILGERLVDGKVHLSALVGDAVLDLPACVTKGSEYFILRVVDENGAVGKIENPWATMFPATVPAHAPKLPADLEGDDGLPARGHGQEDAPLPAGWIRGTPDCDLLVIAWGLPLRW